MRRLAETFLTMLWVITGLSFFGLAAARVFQGRRPALEDLWAALAFMSAGFIALLIAWARYPASLSRPAWRSVVTSVGARHVEVTLGDHEPDRRSVKRLGGRPALFTPWILTFATPDDRSLARVLEGLRDLGLPFATDDRSGPSPMMAFERLREMGLVTGTAPGVDSPC